MSQMLPPYAANQGDPQVEVYTLRARVAELEADNASLKMGAIIRSELFEKACQRIAELQAVLNEAKP